MRKYLSIILLIILAGPVLVKTGMIVNYITNYTYYAEVLCENKDIPMLECNGKCALGKQLNEANKTMSDAEQNIPQLSKLEISNFIPSEKTECSFGTIVIEKEYPSFKNTLLSKYENGAIDRPPAL